MLVNIIVLSIIIIFIAFFTYRIIKKSKSEHLSTTHKYSQSKHASITNEILLINDNSDIVIKSNEISRIPSTAYKLNNSDYAMHRIRHLATDLLKGGASIPNKTIELVFKPEIKEGLADGTYRLMTTKSGETLADAIESTSGKIVGKGRVIEGGKARQIASGMFQLVSIAVAQSHLADIERSLNNIRGVISDILTKQENEDISKITGAIDYLNEIIIRMQSLSSPEELSPEKSHAIEGLIRDAYSWRKKIELELLSLIDDIKKHSNIDTFGTGSTYEELKKLTEKIKPIIKRQEFFVNLSMTINYITAYLDPTHKKFSAITTDNQKWEKAINEFKISVREKAEEFLSSAIFNDKETLELRQYKIKSLANDQTDIAIKLQSEHMNLMSALNKNLHTLIDHEGHIRVAISFDEKGEVKEAALFN
jgi:hypothetical protein